MAYVDGFLIPVAKKKLGIYRKMAQLGARMWMKHGALEYRECIGDDLHPKWGMPFPKLLKLKPGETAIFSWIVYKSKAHRNAVNAKVMKDPLMNEAPKEMPFDMKKMCYGGFKVVVEG
jgi:alkaline phosphatase